MCASMNFLNDMRRMEFMVRLAIAEPALDTTTIIGAKDLEHLCHNIAAARKRPLPADVVAEAYCYFDATGSRPEADTFWRTASAD